MKNNNLSLLYFCIIASAIGLLFFQFDYSVKDSKIVIEKSISNKFKEGDIIFQTSKSLQSQAIQIATKSKFSHVGIIMKYYGKLVVLEAVQPVKITPIKDFIAYGEGKSYSLKRLKQRELLLTKKSIEKMRSLGKDWIGKDYDIAFDWSDNKLYCSELVWKIYQRGCGIEIGKLKKLKDYDLSHPIVKQAIEQRYKGEIPLEEDMISPQAIFESDLLMDVKQ